MLKLTLKTNSSGWPLFAQTSQGELTFSGLFSQTRIRSEKRQSLLETVFTAVLALFGATGLVIGLFTFISNPRLFFPHLFFTGSIGLFIFYLSLLSDLYFISRFFHARILQKQANIQNWMKSGNFEQATDVFPYFSPQSRQCWNRSLFVSRQHGGNYVSGSDILFSLLQDTSVNLFFRRFDGNATDIKIFLLNYIALETPPKEETKALASLPFTAFLLAARFGTKQIEPLILLDALSKSLPEDHIIHSIFSNLGITETELKEAVNWIISVNKLKQKVVLLKSNLHPDNWQFSSHFLPTPLLNRYGANLSHAAASGTLTPALGHNAEITALAEHLLKNDSIFLVGNPGSGKMSLVHEFAYAQCSGHLPAQLQNKQLIQINFEQLLRACKHNPKLLGNLLSEACGLKNYLLIFPNFHRVVLEKNAEDLVKTFFSFTKDRDLQYIASTTPDGLKAIIGLTEEQKLSNEYILTAPSPSELFLNVALQTTIIEVHGKVFFLFPAIKFAILLGSLYAKTAQPQAAMKILSEAAKTAIHSSKRFELKLTPHGRRIITKNYIASIASNLYQIPQNAILDQENQHLLEMEKALAKYVIGQSSALTHISETLRRTKGGLTKNGLLGSLLFIGPMGSGKTETAKALALTYLGKTEFLLRIDAQSQGGNITNIVQAITNHIKHYPLCLLLIENFEAASPELCSLLLALLKTGSFQAQTKFPSGHCPILLIASSTTGTGIIRSGIDEHKSPEEIKTNLLKTGFLENCPPELLGIFNSIVIFSPLSKSDLEKVVILQLNQLKAELAKKKINIHFTNNLILYIRDKTYNQELGARLVRRYIAEHIENLAAEIILKKKTAANYEFTFDIKDNKVIVS